ncbi:hypothetical protein CLV68_3602 [Actinokineospora cianjurensis]|uniref:Uncharacterized protein n=1 Tax=Actinokineospora cianjurensis TaxID=585224 RepID=A0A421B4A6_9PSEU|nr:hypothetical protein CLV68_3602 [Actinokineospora cianjurensis]
MVIAVLVLGGGGVGLYFLLNKDSGNSASPGGGGGETTSSTTTTKKAPKTTTDDETTTTKRPTTTTADGGGTGGGGEDLKAAGAKYADAVNAKDEATAKALTCSGTDAGIMYTSVAPNGGKVTVVGEPETYGDSNGKVDTQVTVMGSAPIDFPIVFEKKSKGWCVSL